MFGKTIEYGFGFLLHGNHGYLTDYPFPGVGAIDSSRTDIYMESNYFPTYLINGINYDSVAEISHTGLTDNYIDMYYINNKAGVVKMVFHYPSDTTIYNLGLIRYHIVH